MTLRAAHLDHGLDPGSGARSLAASRLSAQLGVPITISRLAVRSHSRAGESREAAARRLRYEFLHRLSRELGARWIATAHHRDDQAETVLLRMLFGSGLAGLGGIRTRWDRVVRPLLQVGRRDLLAALELSGLRPVYDPTNDDLRTPRNHIRHRLLPELEREDPEIGERLARLACHAHLARRRVETRLLDYLQPVETPPGIGIRLRELERLPSVLRAHALALMHRQAGAPYPAGRAAQRELARQLTGRMAVGCDCGAGWRWEREGELLTLRRRRPPVPVFTYTLEVPGELEIPELSLHFRMSHAPVASWMFRRQPDRAALALPLRSGDRVAIRNRRPGDRLQPLGCARQRKLKDVLIDRRVPRAERDRLPLLCVGGRIAWIPGVTIDERFRLRRHDTAWVADVVRS